MSFHVLQLVPYSVILFLVTGAVVMYGVWQLADFISWCVYPDDEE